jgi:hypothetical protein
MVDVSPSSFPPPMPLAEAPQPIALLKGPHLVVLAPPYFFSVITTYVSIPIHPFQTYKLIIFQCMLRVRVNPLQHNVLCSNCGFDLAHH